MERHLTVLETSIFAKEFKRGYMMMNEQERIDAKLSNPELNIRLADAEEESRQLCVQEEDGIDESLADSGFPSAMLQAICSQEVL